MKNAEIYRNLMSYDSVHSLNQPITEGDLSDFEKTNGITLPEPLKDLYRHFDGGEIFIPGTLIYGCGEREGQKNLKDANSSQRRKIFGIPPTHLIFAKLNFGDLLCIDLNSPHEIIQWDHENDEPFCTWDSIEEWLLDSIKDYVDYMTGEQ